MKVSTFFNVVILLFLMFLIAISIGYPWQLKLLPWIFIALALLLEIGQIVREVRKKDKVAEDTEGELKLHKWIADMKGANRGYATAMLWMLGLFVSLYVVGFLVTVPLFTILYLKRYGNTWQFSIGLSVIVWGIFFIVFIFGLKVSFYQGWLLS